MYLTDLADAARSSGLPVDGVPGWQTRGVGPMVRVNGVTCHHTGTPASVTGDIPTLPVLADGHRTLSGPLCNIGLSKSGVVWIVAAGYANHAGVSHKTSWTNPYMIGIEAEHAGGTQPWPKVQYDAYVKLCRALSDWYKFPVSEVKGHKETAYPAGRKPDPTFNMTLFRTKVRLQSLKPKPKEEPLMVTKADEQKIRNIVSDEIKKALAGYRQPDPTQGVLSASRATQLTGLLLRDSPDGIKRPNLQNMTDALQRIETEVTK